MYTVSVVLLLLFITLFIYSLYIICWARCIVIAWMMSCLPMVQQLSTVALPYPTSMTPSNVGQHLVPRVQCPIASCHYLEWLQLVGNVRIGFFHSITSHIPCPLPFHHHHFPCLITFPTLPTRTNCLALICNLLSLIRTPGLGLKSLFWTSTSVPTTIS